jgi:uncharacterized membrane protein
MSTGPSSDPPNSGAEPVYGPSYTAARAKQAVGAQSTPPAAAGDPPPVGGPSPPYTAPYPPYPSDTSPGYGLSPVTASGLAYFTLIPAIFFLLMEPYKSNATVRFHSWQSVFFFLAVAAVRAVEGVMDTILPPVGAYGLEGVLSLVILAVWLMVVVQAFSGKRYLLPGIGAIAEKTASGPMV